MAGVEIHARGGRCTAFCSAACPTSWHRSPEIGAGTLFHLATETDQDGRPIACRSTSASHAATRTAVRSMAIANLKLGRTAERKCHKFTFFLYCAKFACLIA